MLVVQMQGATIDTRNNSAYGSVTSSTAGQYEYAIVTSVSGSTITLNKALANTYITSPANPASITNSTNSNQNFQVIRVPQYSSLTVNGLVTGTAWSSQTKIGGVLALDVAGVTDFGTTGDLSMTGRGFAGGGGVRYTGPAPLGTNKASYATLAGVQATATGAHGSKGEGIAGTPRYFYNGTTVVDNGTTNEGYATGSNNQGAPANGGGGAQDFTPTDNSGNSGGGGGGNGAPGGIGGYGFGSNSKGNQAVAGYAGTNSTIILQMGGGGGAGSTNNTTNPAASSGGSGGGTVILRTGTVSGTATVEANGTDGIGGSGVNGNNNYLPGTANAGAGGGGAGGTLLLLATPTSPITNSGLATLTAAAAGGGGGNANAIPNTQPYGTGGGGGGGVIFTNAVLNNTAIPGGVAGVTNDGNGNATFFGAASGTAGIANTTITPTNTPIIGGAGACLPMLSVALSTSTPNVTRTNGVPNPATYKALISNTGGTTQNTSTTFVLDPLFTYNTTSPVLTLTTANGTTTTLLSSAYTVTGAGTSAPSFSGITIPSGATLSITFPAVISASAINGTIYQAASAVTFLDPTRSTTAGTATPGGNFAGGGTVPGTNYAKGSNTLANVTIVAPLPVELTRFEATAVRQDALLTWATASEKNNDRFVVERSVDGRSFGAIGTVRGQGTSTRATTYTFTDEGAGRQMLGTIYYRLQQVDTDGTPTFSPVRSVQFAPSSKAVAFLYPNPSQGQATIDLSGLAAGTYRVQVLDLTGRVLRTQELGALAAPLDVSGLPQGAFVVLVKGAGFNQALPLIRN